MQMLGSACLCPVAGTPATQSSRVLAHVLHFREKQHQRCGQTAASNLDHQVGEGLPLGRGRWGPQGDQAPSLKAGIMSSCSGRLPQPVACTCTHFRTRSSPQTTVLHCHAQQPAISMQQTHLDLFKRIQSPGGDVAVSCPAAGSHHRCTIDGHAAAGCSTFNQRKPGCQRQACAAFPRKA